jgi:hypothetical protein
MDVGHVSRGVEQKRIVFGTLDNQPLNDYSSKVGLGSGLALSFCQIREHRKVGKGISGWFIGFGSLVLLFVVLGLFDNTTG